MIAGAIVPAAPRTATAMISFSSHADATVSSHQLDVPYKAGEGL